MGLVSVAVPTCDRADSLGGAVETALDQTHEDLEVAVNDGSTDDTKAVLAEYADDRVRALHDEETRGSAHSRNCGIEAAFIDKYLIDRVLHEENISSSPERRAKVREMMWEKYEEEITHKSMSYLFFLLIGGSIEVYWKYVRKAI